MINPLRLLLLTVAITVTACVSQTVRTVDLTAPSQPSADIPEALLLDVGVALFDPGIPEDPEKREQKVIIPDVREAEANFIPFTLKRMLQSTGQWGAVRVVPRPSNAVDVSVWGEMSPNPVNRISGSGPGRICGCDLATSSSTAMTRLGGLP